MAFLLSVEGLVLFLATRPFSTLLLVSKEKKKVGPMAREKLKPLDSVFALDFTVTGRRNHVF